MTTKVCTKCGVSEERDPEANAAQQYLQALERFAGTAESIADVLKAMNITQDERDKFVAVCLEVERAALEFSEREVEP